MVTIGQARTMVEGILVTGPIDDLIVYDDDIVDQNGDDLICLRVGPPEENPYFGAPLILALDNTTPDPN